MGLMMVCEIVFVELKFFCLLFFLIFDLKNLFYDVGDILVSKFELGVCLQVCDIVYCKIVFFVWSLFCFLSGRCVFVFGLNLKDVF